MAIASIVMLILFLALMPEHFVVAAQTIQDALKVLDKHKPPCEYSARWPNIEISRPSSTWGSIYLDGVGVARNDTGAVNWYRRAAEQGDAKAQSNLGAMCEKGSGVTKKRSRGAEMVSQNSKESRAQ
jgi:hypothetical protein